MLSDHVMRFTHYTKCNRGNLTIFMHPLEQWDMMILSKENFFRLQICQGKMMLQNLKKIGWKI